MKFSFRAKTQTGEVREGSVEAIDIDAAASILQENSLIPISLEIADKKRDFSIATLLPNWQGVSTKEKLIFFQQLATLVESRVPITTSLVTIGEQVTNPRLRLLLIKMANDIDDGMAFSAALEKHPEIFDSLTIGMIRSGETSGNLHHAIRFVADNIEKNYELSSKIKGALYYPAFVLLVAFVIGFFGSYLYSAKNYGDY
jgi:type IV pilus assembly protein PilC